jgi:hypothetical protein
LPTSSVLEPKGWAFMSLIVNALSNLLTSPG